MQLNDFGDRASRAGLGNLALSTAGMVIKAASNVAAKNGSAVAYLNDGVFKSLAANTDAVMTAPSGSAAFNPVPAGFTCLFVWTVTAGGTVKTYQGRPFKTETVDGVSKWRGYSFVTLGNGSTAMRMDSDLVDKNSQFLPEIPIDETPFGAVKVPVNTGQTFTPGTTALDNTTVATVVYSNLSNLPSATDL